MKSSLGSCHLMMGISANELETVHAYILYMAKLTAMLHKQQAKS